MSQFLLITLILARNRLKIVYTFILAFSTGIFESSEGRDDQTGKDFQFVKFISFKSEIVQMNCSHT